MTTETVTPFKPLSPAEWAELFKQESSRLEEEVRQLFATELAHVEACIQTAQEVLSRRDWRALRDRHTGSDAARPRLKRAFFGLVWSALYDEPEKKRLTDVCGAKFGQYLDDAKKCAADATAMLPESLWYRLREFNNEMTPRAYLDVAFYGAMWESLYLDLAYPKNLHEPRESPLRRIAKKWAKYEEADTDAIFDYASDWLATDNYRRVRSYTGPGTPRTHLFARFTRGCRAASFKVFKRCRAPTWVDNMGPAWTAAFNKLCCCKFDADQFATFAIGAQLVDSKQEALDIAKELLKSVPDCVSGALGKGKIPVYVRSSDTDDEDGPDLIGNLPQDEEEGPTHSALIGILIRSLGGSPQVPVDPDHEVVQDRANFEEVRFDSEQTRWQKFCDLINLELRPKEKLLLKAMYSEGMPRDAAAKLHGITASQARTMEDKAMETIKTAVVRAKLIEPELVGLFMAEQNWKRKNKKVRGLDGSALSDYDDGAAH